MSRGNDNDAAQRRSDRVKKS